MLVTHSEGGKLHARPMQVAEVEDSGRLWFLTGADTGKVEEIRADASVSVLFQNERASFLNLSGVARLTRDRSRIEALWSEGFKTWFPQGKDDPNLLLVAVEPEEAEYWDNRGANKVRYAIQALGAYIQGERPEVKEGEQHGRVDLR